MNSLANMMRPVYWVSRAVAIVMILSLLVFSWSVDRFIPTDLLRPLPWYMCVVLVPTWFFDALGVVERRRATRSQMGHATKAQRAPESLLLMPFLGIFMVHAFVAEPLSYALHRWSDPPYVEVIEQVDGAYAGAKRCGNWADLRGDDFFGDRRVCRISADALNQLKHGGSIRLWGYQSRYGITYTRSAVVYQPEPRPRSAGG